MFCLCIACPTLTTSEKSVKTDFSLKNASNAFRPHCATQSFALPKFVLQQLQRNNKKGLESTTKVKFQYEPSGPSGQRFSSVLLLPLDAWMADIEGLHASLKLPVPIYTPWQ